MITSEFGLIKLDHIKTPAGIEELHNSMHKTVIEEISDIPFCFIRGVKTVCQCLEDADMMRGEETELMGISKGEQGVFILPGSHSKIIKTDNNGKITDFKTMLTGEMIMALSENTILKDAVDIKIPDIDSEYLLKGFEYCSENGINDALFKVRVLKNLFGKNAVAVYNFYMGVILCDEIKYVLSKKPQRVTIGGKKPIKEPMAVLLSELTDAEIKTVSDGKVNNSSALGAVKIFEYN